MPSVRFVTRAGRGRREAGVRHPKVSLVGEKGIRLELPYAPPLEHGGLALRWASADRAGRKPLLTAAGGDLRTYNLELLLADRDHQRPVERELQTLRAFARTGQRCRWVGYGPSEGGWFRVTALNVVDERRQHGTNAITRARVRLTLTEASDSVAHLGPVSGGARTEPPAASGGSTAAPAATTHTIVAGDTLWDLAQRYYGSGSKWPRIADANQPIDPRALAVGRVLTIPPPA